MTALVEKADSWHVVFVVGLWDNIGLFHPSCYKVFSAVISYLNMAQPSSATVKLLKLASKESGSEGLSHWETMHLVSGENAMKSYMKTCSSGYRLDA